jgi:hypothetical protein
MTRDEIYEFDLNGYIVYRNILSAEAVGRMNRIIDKDQAEKGAENSFHFPFMDMDPECFLGLMAHPRTLQIIRVMVGDWLRLDHAYAIQMTRETEAKENLHGGPRADQGEHQYQWLDGKMYNGLIVVMYALADVNPGDGGFICVPGSHKANLVHRPPVTSHLVVNPSLRAGDMLIFTEALVHGTRRWQGEHRRRSLLYKYSPGYSTWADYERMRRYCDLAKNDLQRDLLRPPHVGQRTPLKFPEVTQA